MSNDHLHNETQLTREIIIDYLKVIHVSVEGFFYTGRLVIPAANCQRVRGSEAPCLGDAFFISPKIKPKRMDGQAAS